MPEINFSVLELENFKSFKERTRFEWSPMITAVVGLNGVGKSSIVDAIEFVCCFPRYSRGMTVTNLKMTICHLESRESDDANDTWIEISLYVKDTLMSFRRTVEYRNSAQRYCINGAEVNNKEYKKGLLKFNINPRAITWIVQQSGIESFAIQSPKELCILLERLSGSETFKAEYTKLSNELQCLNAEATELKKQLHKFNEKQKDLKRLKAEWTKIDQLEDEYKQCEYDYYLAELYGIDRSVNDLAERNDELCKKIGAADKIKISTEKEIKLLIDMLAEQDKSLALIEAQVEEAKQNMLAYSTKENELKEKLTLSERKIRKIEDNLKKAEMKVKSHESILKELNQEKIKVEKEREAFLSQSQRSPLTLNDEQNELYLQLKSEALKKCSYEINMISSITREQSAIKDKINDYEAKEKSLSQKIKKEKSFIQEMNSKLSNIVNKISETEQKRSNVQTNIDNLMEDIVNSVEMNKQLLADIDSLDKKINEQLDGMELTRNNAKKQKVLDQLKANCNGVHDRLINLFEVGAENIEIDKLEIAITKVLGKKINNIVVDTTDDAVQCIEFMKRYYQGSKDSVVETFLPLDNLKIKKLDRRILEGEKNARFAIDVIDSLDKFPDVFAHLFGDIVICDTDEAASSLSKRKKLDCVSYNGSFYKKDGTFSGGLYDLSIKSKKTWNEKKLQILENGKAKKMASLQEKMKHIESKNKQKCELETQLISLVKRLEDYLKPLLETGQRELKSKKTDLEKKCNDLDNLKNSGVLEDLRNAFMMKTNELEKMEMKKDEIENDVFSDFCVTCHLENIQLYEVGYLNKHMERVERKKELDDHLDIINNQIVFENECHSESENAVRKLQIDLQKSTKEYKKLKKKIDELGNRSDKNKIFFAKDIEIKQTRQKRDQHRKHIKTVETKMKFIERDLKEWNYNLLANKKRIAVLENEKHIILTKCKLKNIDIPLVSGTFGMVNLEAGPSIFSSDTISENSHLSLVESGIEEKNIVINYSKHITSLKKIVDLDSALKLLKNKLTTIREIINENLPDSKVNGKTMIDAKEKVDTLKKNYSTKLKELQDKNENFNTIKNKRKSTFVTFISYVEQKLKKHFKTLFQNSTAEAYIMMKNFDEPYLDGIEFSCVIPNKRFIAMENLSGGEKTMCSIALLHALNSVKLPPFFIFDEIDAALDTVNISRVTQFFLEMKDSTQIIIISHNELMCACADTVVSINISPITNSSRTHHFDISKYSKEVSCAQTVKIFAKELQTVLRQKKEEKKFPH